MEEQKLWRTKDGTPFTVMQKLFGEHYAAIYLIIGLLAGFALGAITFIPLD